MADKLQDAIRRGQEVEHLFEDGAVDRAFDETGREIKDLWARTASEEAGKREELYREWHGLRAVRARLQRVLSEAKKAEAELKAQELENARRARSA